MIKFKAEEVLRVYNGSVGCNLQIYEGFLQSFYEGVWALNLQFQNRKNGHLPHTDKSRYKTELCIQKLLCCSCLETLTLIEKVRRRFLSGSVQVFYIVFPFLYRVDVTLDLQVILE